MTSRKAPYCSDAELLKELRNLGYNDVSPDVFKRMKEDISELVEEEYPSEVPIRREGKLSSSTIVKYSAAHNNYEDVKAKYAEKLKSRIGVDPNISDGSSPLEDDRYTKYRNRLNAFKLESYARKSTEDANSPIVRAETSSSSLSRSYSRLQAKYGLTGKLPEIAKLRQPDRNLGPDLDDPLNKYRQRFKLGTFSQLSDAPGETVDVSQSSDSIILPPSEVRYKHGAFSQRSNVPDVAAEVSRSSESIVSPSSEVRYKFNAFSQRSKVPNETTGVSRSSDSIISPSSEVRYKLGAFSQRSKARDENTHVSQSTKNIISPSSEIRYKSSAFSQRSKVPDENINVSQSSENIISPSSELRYKLGVLSQRSKVQDENTDVSQSSENTISPSSEVQYKLGAFHHRSNAPEKSTEASDSVTSSKVQNKLKRKVLRRRNGEPVVTEEYLDMPNIFNTSYPETESGRSFSSDDLSFKSNASTGSVVSPDAATTTHSASQSSFSTPRSIHMRIASQRKKKTDPVAMYNYYKNYWNNFKPPGEKTHDKLRWAVRDRMLDYNL